MMLWHIGNTTVRSPFRLRDGLIAIKEAGLENRLRGSEEKEKYLCKILSEFGVVSLKSDETFSIGRKWRSAMEKLGFIIPYNTRLPLSFYKKYGKFDSISPNGRRLIEAESVSAWQECFLRALIVYKFIYNQDQTVKTSDGCETIFKVQKGFYPFKHTLSVMARLRDVTGESKISIYEMALFIQCSSDEDDIESIVGQIISFRNEIKSTLNKKQVYAKHVDTVAKCHKKAIGTFMDYADTNFRYLKATGLFTSKGDGIAFSADKFLLVEELIQHRFDLIKEDYYVALVNGAELPTDDYIVAKNILMSLIHILSEYGYEYDLSKKTLHSTADINVVRHEVEELISQYRELDYADKQIEYAEEIEGYIDLLLDRKKRSLTLSTGVEIKIPSSDAPAYFEWVIWRLFLAINSLTNKPWEARRFKIDQDFLPVNCAPGNGPDLIFEYDDMVLVVEVTFTTSSRQEAAEGEPVRRHVAQYAEKYAETSKRVYGLFIAISIDTNTANTFRLGEWYLKDDRKIGLHIVPVNLKSFKKFTFSSLSQKDILAKLKVYMMECRMNAIMDAPEWKDKICNVFEQ